MHRGMMRCATLGMLAYRRIVDKVDQKRQDDMVDFLQPIVCFQAHSRHAIIKFLQHMHRVKFVRNQVVYKEGQPGTRVYLVLKGEFIAST